MNLVSLTNGRLTPRARHRLAATTAMANRKRRPPSVMAAAWSSALSASATAAPCLGHASALAVRCLGVGEEARDRPADQQQEAVADQCGHGRAGENPHHAHAAVLDVAQIAAESGKGGAKGHKEQAYAVKAALYPLTRCHVHPPIWLRCL